MRLLSILIPTYNRQDYLINNLSKLCTSITNKSLEKDVEIIISNNCSTDNTAEKVVKFIEENPTINIQLFNQPKNIGLELNALFVLQQSKVEYVMYLGDDDYIHEEYLYGIINQLNVDKGFRCVIPAYENIDYNGNRLNIGRDVGIPGKVYEAGFENCLKNSYRGHQLSGLTLKREGLWESYRDNKVSNIYLFIYFVAKNCLDGKTWHFTDYPVLVTAALQKDKDWNYGKDGLITDIFDNYKKLKGINAWQRSKLEFRLLEVQSWRYEMYLQRGKKAFIRVIINIIKGKNTSYLTKVGFSFNILFRTMRKIVRKCLP